MRDSALRFKSAFQYSPLASFNDPLEDDIRIDANNQMRHKCVHHMIVATFYLLMIVTFPVSVFFCIKKISSLQRCVVFRLGRRLPLKGPGLIIKLPCIDAIEIVDLSDHEITVVENEQQLLTNDGSIIQFSLYTGKLNVTNAIRSSTQLKDAKFNAEQFVKLSFMNMLGSTHIEDIENKTDVIVNQFEHNCNIYLNNWGWEIKLLQLPKFVVINRADPFNPMLSKLKGFFNGEGENSGPNILFNNIIKPTTSPSTNAKNSSQNNVDPKQDAVLSTLQSMANKYSTFVLHDIFIAIQIREIDFIEYFTFYHQSGEVHKIEEKPPKIHINVIAKTREDLMIFCQTEDMNRVEITTSLL